MSIILKLVVTSELWMMDEKEHFHWEREYNAMDGMSLSPDGNHFNFWNQKTIFLFVPFGRFPYHTYVTDLSGVP